MGPVARRGLRLCVSTCNAFAGNAWKKRLNDRRCVKMRKSKKVLETQRLAPKYSCMGVTL
eukprot:1324290-Amphidinium_carterae.1